MSGLEIIIPIIIAGVVGGGGAVPTLKKLGYKIAKLALKRALKNLLQSGLFDKAEELIEKFMKFEEKYDKKGKLEKYVRKYGGKVLEEFGLEEDELVKFFDVEELDHDIKKLKGKIEEIKVEYKDNDEFLQMMEVVMKKAFEEFKNKKVEEKITVSLLSINEETEVNKSNLVELRMERQRKRQFEKSQKKAQTTLNNKPSRK